MDEDFFIRNGIEFRGGRCYRCDVWVESNVYHDCTPERVTFPDGSFNNNTITFRVSQEELDTADLIRSYIIEKSARILDQQILEGTRFSAIVEGDVTTGKPQPGEFDDA